MVKQECTKAERESGKLMPILGNGKILGRPSTTPEAPSTNDTKPEVDDDVPF
jgi:hypothetical protein